MSGTPIVSLGDVVLGGSTLHDWEFTSGTAPVERAFTVTGTRVAELAKLLGKPSTLKIVGPRATLEVEQLYLLEVHAGDDPFTARIRLADRRWLWPKTWIATTFNARRAGGDKFLAGEGRIENKLIQPGLKFARYSLYPPENPGVPWTPRTALEWTIGQKLGTPVVFDDPMPEIELQDLFVDDPGPAAVERILAHVPGAALFIDELGRAVIFDRFSGKERKVLERLPALQRAGLQVAIVDRRATRPAEVVVLFTPEPEMRLDHTEPVDESGVRDEDEPVLRQVGMVPDAELVIDGVTLARSSWTELVKMFAAWGSFGVFAKPVTFDTLRRHALKYGWAAFEQAWGNNPLVPPDAVNLSRAQTASRSWRHFFQLDRYWTQRLAGIRAYRAAILNTETGAFAPASVYSDWIRRPSFKGFARLADPNPSQGWAVRGYADLLADGEIAPARVDVIDEGAGIISVTPQVDPYGLSQAMLFGYPEGGNLPSQNPGEAKRTGEELYARWDRVVVEAAWKMAVVLTVVPASPNTVDRFYKVSVKPGQIAPDVGPCEGPTVYARVFPGVTTARFAWLDERGEATKAAIKGEGPWPDDTLVNRELLEDVALATAKRIYDTLRDRPLGGASVDLDPTLKPTGAISSVRHAMDGGETTSHVAFHAVTQPADIWRYLNASSRKVINRLLNDPGPG